MKLVDRICDAATAICAATANQPTSKLQKQLDHDIEGLVEAADEASLVKAIVALVTEMGDEESAAFVLRRALAAASRSPGYDG